MGAGVVLGIESSCDDAAVALVRQGRTVLAEAVASQAGDFAAWGGVVPEIAARGHVLALPGLIDEVLTQAALAPAALEAIAVCARPGLVGSLLPGVTAAKVLAARLGVPLVGVDHILAHLAAVHLVADVEPRYPLVGLVASGGHSHFYHCAAPGAAQPLGGTIDDAAGEAFDKAAAMLGLGYPGGPAIEAQARGGDPRAFALPRSFLADATLRLSFAGVKTALLYQVRGRSGTEPLTLSPSGIQDACASFQAAVVDCLAAKLVLAAQQTGCTTIACGGGVACNGALRERLAVEAAARGWQLLLPAPRHCADNGAMIAVAGWHRRLRGEEDPLTLAPLPSGAAGHRTPGVRAPR